MAPSDREQRRAVGRACRLDDERLGAAGEERLPDDRVVDQVEHVGGVAPQLARWRVLHLGAQLAPGRPAVFTVPHGIRPADEALDRLAHGIVENEAVPPRVHERQVEQAPHCVARVLAGEHGREQRLGGPPDNRCGLQCASRRRILDVLEIQPRQLGDHAGRRRLLEAQLGLLRDSGRAEHERQRMTARDCVQPAGVTGADPAPLQEEQCVRCRERAERQALEAVDGEPARHRRLSAGQDDADVAGQRRNEILAEPRVHQPEDLVVVERDQFRRRRARRG